MKRVVAVVLVALTGLAARADERSPVASIPWKPLAEARTEAEIRNVPFLVVHANGDGVGTLASLLAAPKAPTHRLSVGTPSVLVRAESELGGLAGEKPGPPPRAYVFLPDGTLARALDLSVEADLWGALDDAQKRAGKELLNSSWYQNAVSGWKTVEAHRDRLDDPEALWRVLSALESIRDAQKGFTKRFSFADEAEKLHAELTARGTRLLEELAKAVAAKDWAAAGKILPDLRPYSFHRELDKRIRDALTPLRNDPEAAPAIEAAAMEASAKRSEKETAAILAEVAKHRPAALEALRKKVPATEVKDDDVTLVFWEEVRDRSLDAQSGKIVEGKTLFFAGGFWLGPDRCCVLAWDPGAKKLVPTGKHTGPNNKVDFPEFVEVRATDDALRQVLALVRRVGRYERKLVVPTEVKPGKEGGLAVTYFDGWDDGCGHWSFGWFQVDPERGTLRGGAHVK